MEHDSERQIEAILSRTRFPGEDEGAILEYLDSVNFTDTVMKQVLAEHRTGRKAVVWGALAMFTLLLLVFFGVGGTLSSAVPVVPDILYNFIFLFLGMTFLGSVIGIVLSLDTSWFERLLQKI
jgi:hypothetical protein